MKKGSIIEMLACTLLCAWYLMSIVGFDVHTDHHDARTYVVSLLSNLSCEHIHPEDECCCELDDEAEYPHDDCDDETDVLVITGTNGVVHHFDLSPVSFVSEILNPALAAPTVVCANASSTFRLPPRLLLNSLCVLRV